MLKRLLVVAAPLGAAALAVGLTLRGFAPADLATEAAADQPRYTVEGAEWTRYDEAGNAAIRARATRIDYYDDRSAQLQQVTVDRLGDQGPWTLKAAQGEIPPNQTRMQLSPDVEIDGRLRSGAPADLRTRHVWVDWTARTLASAEPVEMRSPNRELQAVGFESDWAGEQLRFLKDVKVRYAPPG
ncbi:MAG TPA: LPS export ABC transporter periplasmic protein LptC [Solimonas sp.]